MTPLDKLVNGTRPRGDGKCTDRTAAETPTCRCVR